MINLYEKLGIPLHANTEQIQRAIKRAAQQQSMSLVEIQKAKEWLLNSEIRKKYNAKLFAEHPELLEQLSQQAAPVANTAPQTAPTKQLKKTNHHKLLIAGLLMALLLGIYYVASPYWALRQLAKAAENGDVETMSKYIDYPAVKDSVSRQFKTVIMQKMQHDPSMQNNPFATAGTAVILPMIDGMVDMIVSKEGMRALFNGEKQQQRRKEAQAHGKTLRLREADLDYQGLNSMHATITSKKGEKITFIFEREGFADWKMKSIALPINDWGL